jgi:HSF-type DNA-binding
MSSLQLAMAESNRALLTQNFRRIISDIIRWQPHGRGFVILDRKRLETDVLPLWFNQTKIESFFKQLNLYGFKVRLRIMLVTESL